MSEMNISILLLGLDLQAHRSALHKKTQLATAKINGKVAIIS